RGDRRGCAFIDVGRPHVERDGGNFEGETGYQEDKTEDEADGNAASLHDHGDCGKTRTPGETIDQRYAVQHHSGRQRAEHEIFETGFGGAEIVAVERGKYVECQTLELEAEIERDEIASRCHQHHAEH